MPLPLVGHWKAKLADDHPLPQELETTYPPGVAEQIAGYLEAGGVFEEYRGTSWCRCGCKQPNGSKELTDGTWVWPEGLAHYLRQHPIALPPDLVRDACRPGAPRPAAPLPQTDQDVDDSYWIEWARQFRRPSVEKLLAEARAAARRACDAALEAEGVRTAARLGMTEVPCATAGCSRRAVVGKALCGLCLAQRDRIWMEARADWDELARLMLALPAALSRSG